MISLLLLILGSSGVMGAIGCVIAGRTDLAVELLLIGVPCLVVFSRLGDYE